MMARRQSIIVSTAVGTTTTGFHALTAVLIALLDQRVIALRGMITVGCLNRSRAW